MLQSTKEGLYPCLLMALPLLGYQLKYHHFLSFLQFMFNVPFSERFPSAVYFGSQNLAPVARHIIVIIHQSSSSYNPVNTPFPTHSPHPQLATSQSPMPVVIQAPPEPRPQSRCQAATHRPGSNRQVRAKPRCRTSVVFQVVFQEGGWRDKSRLRPLWKVFLVCL